MEWFDWREETRGRRWECRIVGQEPGAPAAVRRVAGVVELARDDEGERWVASTDREIGTFDVEMRPGGYPLIAAPVDAMALVERVLIADVDATSARQRAAG